MDKKLIGICSIFMATFALLFGVYGVFTCNALEFPSSDSNGGALSVGLYGYRTKAFTVVAGDPSTVWVSETCAQYTSLFTYSADKMTSALQALAISLGVIGFVFTVVSCCCCALPPMHPFAWKGLGLIFLVCCILQGCSLLVLQSSICLDNPLIQYLTLTHPIVVDTLKDPNKCEWAAGFKFGITATVFWGVAGFMVLFSNAPSMLDEGPPYEDDNDNVAAASEPRDVEEEADNKPADEVGVEQPQE